MRPALWFALPLLSTSGAFALQHPAGSPGGGRSPAPTADVVGPTFRFGDFDADGLDDVYVIDPLVADRLFKNLGTGAFEDVTVSNGLEGITGTRMALWFDFDGDRALDLYVSHAGGRSRLYQNTYNGLFVDVTSVSGLAHDGSELFAEVVDYDADQVPDLHLVTEQGDLLFRNVGRGQFERASLPALSGDATVVDGAPGSTNPAHGALGAPASDSGGSDVQPGSPAADTSAVPKRPFSLGEARSSFASSGSSTSGGSLQSPPSTQPGVLAAICSPTIDDLATANCIQASSVPGTLGLLYPLSTNLFVSAAGNVGVGTTAPTGKLDVVGTMHVDYGGANSGTSLNALRFGDQISVEAIGSKRTASGNQFGIDFYTNAINRMAITNSGLVGIGTTTPVDRLDVAGRVNVDFADQNSGTIANTLRMGGGGSGEGFGSKRTAGGNQFGIDFYTSSINRMAVTQVGNVGIGTTAPEGRLHVLDGSAGSVTADVNSALVVEDSAPSYLSILTPDAEERGILFGEPSNNRAGGLVYNNGFTPDGLQLRTNGNLTRMVVSSTGNVGIGTTAPANKLQVVDTVTDVASFQGSNTGGTWVDFGNTSAGGHNWALLSTGSANGEGPGAFCIHDHNASTTRVIIDTFGNLGIGRSASANRLEVEGNASKTTAGLWLANSDRRIKTQVRGLEAALATLDRVRPVAFHYTHEFLAAHPDTADIEYYNVIAQEFAEVFPDYVKDSGENGILQVDTYPALIHAIAAVQELHAIVEEKDQELAELGERLAHLEAAVATLAAAK